MGVSFSSSTTLVDRFSSSIEVRQLLLYLSEHA